MAKRNVKLPPQDRRRMAQLSKRLQNTMQEMGSITKRVIAKKHPTMAKLVKAKTRAYRVRAVPGVTKARPRKPVGARVWLGELTFCEGFESGGMSGWACYDYATGSCYVG